MAGEGGHGLLISFPSPSCYDATVYQAPDTLRLPHVRPPRTHRTTATRRAGLIDDQMEDFMRGLTDEQARQALQKANRLP